MRMPKYALYFLVIAMLGVLALGCGNGGGAPTGEVYQGQAEGYNGTITVQVTMDEGTITDIAVTDHSETPGIGDVAFDELIPKIIDNQGTAGVDIRTGATVTCEALFEAVDDALSKAQ